MVLVPLVEGHGEVTAAPELVRRICHNQGRYDIHVRPGCRAHRSELANPEKLRTLIEAVYVQYRPDAILVLLDADDDCPKDLADRLKTVCDSAPARTALVAANREYEAWFLGAIESLRGQASVRDEAESHPAPESPRDAKGQLSQRMTEPYAETLHQRKFSAALDLAQADQACRSFRRLNCAITYLLGS